MKTLLRYFAQGVLVAAPMLLTLYLVITLMAAVDGLMHIPIPGLGLVVTLCILTLLGFVASSVIGTRVMAQADVLLRRVPLVKILYRALKDLVSAFVGDRKGFDRPVSVQLPGAQVRLLGFITRDAIPLAGFEQYVAVYFPQAYNFAGNLLFVPRASVQPLSIKSSELMSFIISGGIAGLQPPSELAQRDG
ncbi:MAG: DUF502 domain-containing protein [Deltaproteobacteria bacterium]